MIELYWCKTELPEEFNLFHQWAYLEAVFVLNCINIERFLIDITLAVQRKKFIILSGDLAVHVRRWLEKAFNDIRVIHYDEEVVNAYCFCARNIPFPTIKELNPDVFYLKYDIFKETMKSNPATLFVPLTVPYVDVLNKWMEQ